MDIQDSEAVIFDLDGVVTDTARAHSAAWKELFDGYLCERFGEQAEFFDPVEDYRRYVDGKPRYEGVDSFLRARGIVLPRGDRDDHPAMETVCGLGNRKNELYRRRLDTDGVDVFDDALRAIRALRARGLKTAVVSSSKNCQRVLAIAGIEGLFDARVDGLDLERSELRGKPQPDMFLEAARRLDVAPERAVMVEDAVVGVQAGRAAGFGLVVGLARGEQQAGALWEAGADRVLHDLESWSNEEDMDRQAQPQMNLPNAIRALDEIMGRARGHHLAVFLDYDGTLSPIVTRPEMAVLSDEMRRAVRALAKRCTVAVVSGRDLADVRERVGIEGIAYAGSHGFDIEGADGRRHQAGEGAGLPALLERVAGRLRARLKDIDGAQLEQKRFSLAVHYRRAAEADVPLIKAIVDETLAEFSALRCSPGKMVFDLQPDIDWHKGRAVEWLLETLGLQKSSALALYIGDDVTDEDAFRALKARGIGIVVSEEARQTQAGYVLRDPGEVQSFLLALSQALEGQR
ncbi:MAG: trehalose-phosphatase [Bradymonadaceae bacterium]|nr:trehalose-phosphatase [Lujinxingiaceae bacterium]